MSASSRHFSRTIFLSYAGELTVLQFPHGHSNLTYLLRSGGDEWVLRRPPFGNQVKSAHDMGREFRVLIGTEQGFPPAPRPLVFCEDESILGAPFYVMERRRGLILRRGWPPDLPRDPALLRKMCGSLIDTLADLHANQSARCRSERFRQTGRIRRGARSRAGPNDTATRRPTRFRKWTRRRNGWQLECRRKAERHSSTTISNSTTWRLIPITRRKFPRCSIGRWPPSAIRSWTWERRLGYWVEASEIEQLSASFIGPTWLPGALTRKELVERYAERRGLGSCDMRYYHVFGLFKIAVIVQQIYVRFAADLRAIHGSLRSMPASANWPGKPRTRLPSELS